MEHVRHSIRCFAQGLREGNEMAKVDRTQTKQSERRAGIYDRPDRTSQTANRKAIIIGIVVAIIVAILLWLWLT
jgi:hypothetical protein